ncbi:hypothetical protein [Christiangramia sp. LLG6405-1]|uniref:hypothetical protein n=1 Tax=Christiangramia sp. LLG6405-1 TaxID=3160832 RepID=UPI0038651CD4
MGIEIIAGLLAVILGGIYPLLKKIIEKTLQKPLKKGELNKFQKTLADIFEIEKEKPKSYKIRLEETLSTLNKAFKEVDKATEEFTILMKEKEQTIDILEQKLKELSKEEAEIKERVDTLQKIPLEAISHFEQIVNKGDKRSALRDYLLFVSGIIVSVIVTIILKVYFNF